MDKTLKKDGAVYWVLLGLLADGRQTAGGFAPGALGSACARGWVDVVNGWAALTELGTAVALDNLHEEYRIEYRVRFDARAARGGNK